MLHPRVVHPVQARLSLFFPSLDNKGCPGSGVHPLDNPQGDTLRQHAGLVIQPISSDDYLK